MHHIYSNFGLLFNVRYRPQSTVAFLQAVYFKTNQLYSLSLKFCREILTECPMRRTQLYYKSKSNVQKIFIECFVLFFIIKEQYGSGKEIINLQCAENVLCTLNLKTFLLTFTSIQQLSCFVKQILYQVVSIYRRLIIVFEHSTSNEQSLNYYSNCNKCDKKCLN